VVDLQVDFSVSFSPECPNRRPRRARFVFFLGWCWVCFFFFFFFLGGCFFFFCFFLGYQPVIFAVVPGTFEPTFFMESFLWNY